MRWRRDSESELISNFETHIRVFNLVTGQAGFPQ